MNVDARPVRIILFDDDVTPAAFVAELLTATFGMSDKEARTQVDAIGGRGRIECGPYPASVAKALLDAARAAVSAAGHPLKIGSERVAPRTPEGRCDFCGQPGDPGRLFSGAHAVICPDCVRAQAREVAASAAPARVKFCHEALSAHFAGLAKEEIVTSTRSFPATMRADLQKAIERLLESGATRTFGVEHAYRYEALTFAGLMRDTQHASLIAPVQTSDIDIGDEQPVRCFDNVVFLREQDPVRYAALVSQLQDIPGRPATTRVEIAVPSGADGAAVASRLFRELEAAITAARSYRGRVLSLEQTRRYSGAGGAVRVHRLAPVAAEALILPAATRRLLERNVIAFATQRERLRALGQSTKKGILLYGPPGTGKTHTIRYLACNLPGHTTLIVTAEQVGLLAEYFALARLLQPAMLVIEDVDLVARNREEMDDTCSEVLLNRILNEMDGLAPDADLFFVMTTNRPEQIEPALASRPGRIDQAIEIPMPDAEGREKLVRLYGTGLTLSPELVDDAVVRTRGVSAAFIKELMRRLAQAALDHGDGCTPSPADLATALDEMLFAGGHLNLALLGAPGASASGGGG